MYTQVKYKYIISALILLATCCGGDAQGYQPPTPVCLSLSSLSL